MSTYSDNVNNAIDAVDDAQEAYDQQLITAPSDIAALNRLAAGIDAAKAELAAVQARATAAQLAALMLDDPGDGAPDAVTALAAAMGKAATDAA